MISATMRSVKRSIGGTPAVTIDSALGSGTSEGGEAGVFQHGCMDDKKLRRMRLRTSVSRVLQNDNSGDQVNQQAYEDPLHPVSLLVALGSVSRTRVTHPSTNAKDVASRFWVVQGRPAGTLFSKIVVTAKGHPLDLQV